MKIIVLFVLLVGIILLVSGYLELYFNSKEIKTEVEYRFVPRNVYDQLESNGLEEQFSYMFNANDVRNNTNLI
jgi:hypothetical protein|tara:strand:- start:6 stop:224 length:219 start_codon:yes stop_codon:yes gene_type:complete